MTKQVSSVKVSNIFVPNTLNITFCEIHVINDCLVVARGLPGVHGNISICDVMHAMSITRCNAIPLEDYCNKVVTLEINRKYTAAVLDV